ncbi:hypothetical protein ACFOZ4_34430 [Hamadaea flava]|uniref:Uncharacterized protein n=1 Tax=Hamadaea flava TaxID=1742688 RepID=A0ABV8LXE3_9ACTN|nr:hypothetical protein [Hamadaea flava]
MTTAFVAALSLLALPSAALADAGTPAKSTTFTQWYDPTVHPKPHNPSVGSAGIGPLQSGGGCRDTLGAGSCISFHSPKIWSDFYINSFNGISSNGTAYVYQNINGSELYKGTILTNFTGQSPVWMTSVGSGSAYTIVDFFDGSGNYLSTANSWTVYYP